MSEGFLEERYLPDPDVCRRYGVTPMTLWRWDHSPELGFPAPIRIGSRKYRSAIALLEWERSRAATSEKRKPTASK